MFTFLKKLAHKIGLKIHFSTEIRVEFLGIEVTLRYPKL